MLLLVGMLTGRRQEYSSEEGKPLQWQSRTLLIRSSVVIMPTQQVKVLPAYWRLPLVMETIFIRKT